MKVLFLNGSPRKGGNTTAAIDEMVQIFEAEGIETEVIRVGNKAIRGCIACNSCAENGQCLKRRTALCWHLLSIMRPRTRH